MNGSELTVKIKEFLTPQSESVFPQRRPMGDERFGDIVLRFRDLQYATKLPDAAIIGVPQDIGVNRNFGRTGAALAPDAIRRAFYKLTTFAGKTTLSADKFSIVECGNITVEGLSLEEIHRRQEQAVWLLLKAGITPIILGGGHDIAWPNGQALAKIDASYGVLNIDAHPDVRPLDAGKGHSGTAFRQILENKENPLPTGAFVEFGIQSFATSVFFLDFLRSKQARIVFYDDIRRNGFDTSVRDVFDYLASKARSLYTSFDIDSCASAYAPGASAPSTLGFTAEEICRAAYIAGKNPAVRLIDIVEVNPNFDADNRTAKLAAIMMAQFISGLAERKFGIN
ncbi:MAG: formimidoylglutamase [Bacteroidetes bacterium]|nr:formimidoylglutamase [Bacteroidota bacterium]MCZ2133105.1 formimidoylglutamase [Bacteroidota bacterium]